MRQRSFCEANKQTPPRYADADANAGTTEYSTLHVWMDRQKSPQTLTYFFYIGVQMVAVYTYVPYVSYPIYACICISNP